MASSFFYSFSLFGMACYGWIFPGTANCLSCAIDFLPGTTICLPGATNCLLRTVNCFPDTINCTPGTTNCLPVTPNCLTFTTNSDMEKGADAQTLSSEILADCGNFASMEP